ncbi:MAG: helix-turn-helix domain-containing protein [Ginsengibacter sp.]
MILKDFLPNPAFREFIQCYRICHFEFDKSTQTSVKAYPPKPEECIYFIFKGSLEIEFMNRGKKNLDLPIILFGQQTSINKRCFFGSVFLNFQIVFQPTGLFRLTGIPSFELTNQYFDSENIFSKNIRFIHEQLQDAKSYSEMLLIADRFVGTLVSNARKEVHLLDSVSKFMMQRAGNIPLDWLAKESCLCSKQFKRKFNERVGVNPKTYARIIRFTKAFNTKNAYPNWDWLRIAIECDYFDYQHLVKDYKDFTGLTPNEFHLLENNSPESRLGLSDELYRSRIGLEMPSF